jgi:uncharacterized protein with PIN domain
MKLLCDQMLGTLAKWLRIIGIDTLYAPATSTDDTILHQAQQEHRILITRDTDLVYQAHRHQIPTIHLTSTTLDDQLLSVLIQLPRTTHKMLSRCTLCNHQLHTIDKATIQAKVPPAIFTSHDQFWYCSTCDKIYWHGTHYNHMHQKLHDLTTQVESSARAEPL